jgi:hypothetical protein
MEVVKDITFKDGKTLIVFDDKIMDFVGKENEEIVEWFVKGAHHRGCSVIVLLQNAFAKNMRTVSINSFYHAHFNNPRDRSTIMSLGKQTFPGKPKFLCDAYEKAVVKPFGYLFLDFHQLTNDSFRVRSTVFPTQDCLVFVPTTNVK